MNRREFLRMAAGVAVALRLGKVVVAESASKVEMLHTPWIDHAGLSSVSFIGPAAEQWAKDTMARLNLARQLNMTPAQAEQISDVTIKWFDSWQLPEADRGWHSVDVQLKESTGWDPWCSVCDDRTGDTCPYTCMRHDGKELRGGHWLINGEWQ